MRNSAPPHESESRHLVIRSSGHVLIGAWPIKDEMSPMND
jgi:hypothetical protein